MGRMGKDPDPGNYLFRNKKNLQEQKIDVMAQYIFGYGSLIEQHSRMLTVPNVKKAFPAIIKGYTRGWWARTKVIGFSTTYLGCLEHNSELLSGQDLPDYVNGVLFEVVQEEVTQLDEREKNYKRVQIPLEKITAYETALPGDAVVWVYLNKFEDKKDFLNSCATKDFPIVQSYVDICINGCFEIERDFADAKKDSYLNNFISSTIFWSPFWANDRIYPRRPHVHCRNAFLIDQYLKENLDKSIFESIYIE
jgi:cation transport regulator ChaC